MLTCPCCGKKLVKLKDTYKMAVQIDSPDDLLDAHTVINKLHPTDKDVN